MLPERETLSYEAGEGKRREGRIRDARHRQKLKFIRKVRVLRGNKSSQTLSDCFALSGMSDYRGDGVGVGSVGVGDGVPDGVPFGSPVGVAVGPSGEGSTVAVGDGYGFTSLQAARHESNVLLLV